MSLKFQCYLCDGRTAVTRKGHARDNEKLVPLECSRCGLVRLSSFAHITDSFYADSHMHDSKPYDPILELEQSKEDSYRRFSQFKDWLAGKNVLDFGCGAGGFMLEARKIAASVIGVEPERKLYPFFDEQNLTVFPSLSEVPDSFSPDIVTMFHVLEHIPDPLSTLHAIKKLFFKKGRENKKLIIEVPNANDALLSLYLNDSFSRFTYWSCHLYLFTEDNLKVLAEKVGFSVISMLQYQRYPLANHLYWLVNGKPGGQFVWDIFNTPALIQEYNDVLKNNKICDTVIGVFC